MRATAPSRRRRTVVSFLLPFLLAACGGGGGGGGGEPVILSPLVADPAVLDFGEVQLGGTADRAFTVTNPTLDPITVDSATLPGPGLILTGPPFPRIFAPGETVAYSLRYEADAAGAVDGDVVFSHAVLGGALHVPVVVASPGESVVDLGTHTVNLVDETPLLAVSVPADALSVTFEALADEPDAVVELRDLYGPGGRIYVENGDEDVYLWREGEEVLSTTIPNSDRPETALVPGGGTYFVRFANRGGGDRRLSVRAIIERRPGGSATGARMDLNVWIAPGVGPIAALAPKNARMQSVLATLETVLLARGIELGAIAYYDVDDPDYLQVSRDELPEMLRLTAASPNVRTNLFFVRELHSANVVGVSRTISGPKRNGTGASGLAVIYDGGLSASTIGAVAAHEVGHLLGLYHTVESDGTHDYMDDTPNCPAVGPGQEPGCGRDGGELLMHWQYLGGRIITDGQGMVLRAHPLLSPGSLVPPPVPLTLPEPIDPLPDGWCGSGE